MNLLNMMKTMNRPFRWLNLASAAVLALGLTASAHATSYSYNWNSGFAVGGVVPDANTTGWSDTRTLAGISESFIEDVNVTLNLSGGWNGDLYAYLVHGSGFSVLLNRVGRTAGDGFGSGDAGMNVTLDDNAANGDIHLYGAGNILGGAAWAADGRNVNPLNTLDTDGRGSLLNTFNGQDPNGQWTLFIADLSGGDVSTLTSWGLNIEASSGGSVSVPDGGASSLLVAIGLGALGLLRFRVRPAQK